MPLLLVGLGPHLQQCACPLLELEVLLLNVVLKVYDYMCALIQHLASDVLLLAEVVPPVLGLAEAAVCDLQLAVLVRRWKCTTAKDVVHMPHLLIVLLKRAQVQTMLGDGPCGVGLQVEHVLYLLGQRGHVDVEVRALRVGHGLKTLLPRGILLVRNREERDWHHGGVGEAALTHEGECDLCCLLDDLIQLDADDVCHPQLRRVEGYHHGDLKPILTVDYRHATTVDRNIPVVAELEECVVPHSREPRAMLAHGIKAPFLSNRDVGALIHVQLKTQQ
jgi:hypothetical protein